MMVWNEFDGRWLHHDDFVYPQRSDDIPRMKRINDFGKYKTRDNGWR